MANTATPASYTRLLMLLDWAEHSGRDLSGTRAQIKRCQDEGAFTEELALSMINILEELGDVSAPH